MFSDFFELLLTFMYDRRIEHDIWLARKEWK